MGLVYATLLSLVPLIAFAFAVLKAFGAHRELEPLILEFFRPMGEQRRASSPSASWNSPTASAPASSARWVSRCCSGPC